MASTIHHENIHYKQHFWGSISNGEQAHIYEARAYQGQWSISRSFGLSYAEAGVLYGRIGYHCSFVSSGNSQVSGVC